jgi:hypothetical protein
MILIAVHDVLHKIPRNKPPVARMEGGDVTFIEILLTQYFRKIFCETLNQIMENSIVSVNVGQVCIYGYIYVAAYRYAHPESIVCVRIDLQFTDISMLRVCISDSS